MNGEKRHIYDINKTINFSKNSKIKKNLIIYCPPFTLISKLKNKMKNTNIKVGAQDIHYLNNYGAYTGSVNAKLIKSAGADYVIIGHSEKRFQDDDIMINKKIKSALKEKLKVIFCIGETSKEKKNKLTLRVLKRQLTIGLMNINKINNIIIAYEPRWAIGTGKIPNLIELNKNIKNVNKIVTDLKKNQNFRIIYGGSVNYKNINELIKIKDLKGFLIGSASLRSKNFIDIIKKSTN